MRFAVTMAAIAFIARGTDQSMPGSLQFFLLVSLIVSMFSDIKELFSTQSKEKGER